MPRIFSELLEQMRRLVMEIPEAGDLVERFASRAVVRPWKRKTVYNPSMSFHFKRQSHLDPFFVVMLPEGSTSPPDDALAWVQRVWVNGDDEIAHALFVDALPCHEEWIALKAIYEYATAEVTEASREMLWGFRPIPGLSLQQVADFLAPTAKYLLARQEILLARIVDRCLQGRVMERVKVLKQTSSMDLSHDQQEQLGRTLMRQLRNLTPTRWPDPRNRDEYHARLELLRSSARGLVLGEFCEKPLIH